MNEQLPPGAYYQRSFEQKAALTRRVVVDSGCYDEWWKNYAAGRMGRTVVVWEQDSHGFYRTVGEFGGEPVVVSVFWGILEGHYVAFVEATSTVVHWGMVDAWVKETFPALVASNSNNFHAVEALRWGAPFPLPVPDDLYMPPEPAPVVIEGIHPGPFEYLTLSDAGLAQLAKKVQAHVEKDGKFYKVTPLPSLRNTAFTWDPALAPEPTEGLVEIGKTLTFHQYGAPMLFKPSIAEVLESGPLPVGACAFVLRGPDSASDLNHNNAALQAGYHVAEVTWYGKEPS